MNNLEINTPLSAGDVRSPGVLPKLDELREQPFALRVDFGLDVLPEAQQGGLMEWLVAQELWRRAAIRGAEFPESMAFWSSASHEVDFVLNPNSLLEVKRGSSSPMDFAWFPLTFPKARLTVISASRFETDRIVGITLEDFLLGKGPDIDDAS